MSFLKKTSNILKIKYVQTLLLILLYVVLNPYLSSFQKNFLFSLSGIIKDLIFWIIPIAVAGYVSFTINSFGKKAGYFIVFLLIFEFISNVVSSLFGFEWFHMIHKNVETSNIFQENPGLSTIFSLPFKRPSWYSCGKSVIIGIILGLVFQKSHFLERYKNFSEFILTKILSRFISIFVLGYFANMHQKKIAYDLISNYGSLVLYLFLGMKVYIFLIYFFANECNFRKTILSIKNVFPAWLISLTTSCSLSTMPLTISCVSKNVKDPSFAKSMIPTTTNIQQVGDSIMISFIAISIYYQFFSTMPSVKSCLLFSVFMSVARFSSTAIAGGTVFIILPIIEKTFSFTPEMSAIFLALNMILDPIVTAGNVLGNGGLCQLMEKIFDKVMKKF